MSRRVCLRFNVSYGTLKFLPNTYSGGPRIYSGLDSVLNAPSRKQGHIRLPDDPEARG